MNPFINNWTYGETSPKFGGRFDLGVYQQGCQTLSNFRPMKQGGITRRPPLKHLGSGTLSRLITFTLSSGESFILEFSQNKLSVWKETITGFEKVLFTENAETKDYTVSPYKDSSIWEFQYAQYYDRMYFAHSSYKQKCLYFHAGGGSGYFSFEDFNITTEVGVSLGKSSQHYPSIVAICQNRLWFGSTLANPYTMWASRPYEDTQSHSDFTTKDLATTDIEVLKDTEDWPTKLDPNGYEIYDLTDATKLTEIVREEQEVITARCGMELELASGRNDKLSWIAPLNNIVVGTEASEWILPYNIDPTRQSASMQSSYGSQYIQPVVLNNGLFYIQNGNRLREYTMTEQGGISLDHSFTADHILKEGVKQLATMRTPDPTLFALLQDGTLATFTYDQMYGIQSWSRWSTDGDIISIATKETPKKEDRLVCTVKRGDNYYLEYFDFDEDTFFIDRYEETVGGTTPSVDSNITYLSEMIDNKLDFLGEDGTSIGKNKKIKDVWVRAIDSGRVKAGISGYLEESGVLGSVDHRILVSGGARKEMSLVAQSVDSDPLTLLALTYNVEVN